MTPNNTITDEMKVEQREPVTPEIEARFWAKVDKRGPDECWPWLGGKGSSTANGNYGRMSITHTKSRPAHQVSWEIANGVPFPSGMQGCHSCDNPWCVNPSHIWPGTQAQNIQDCASKGRLNSAVKTHCKHGHALTPDNRRMTIGGWSRCIECARRTGREWKRRFTMERREGKGG